VSFSQICDVVSNIFVYFFIYSSFSFFISQKVKERVSTLEKIKGEVRGLKNSILSTEFCALIDRELEMLRRGRPPGAVVGLRKRISLAFHYLMEQCSAQHG
jgi:hypothetical protein